MNDTLTKDERVKCPNQKCKWRGTRDQCVHMHNDPNQLDCCPKCDWPVIPRKGESK